MYETAGSNDEEDDKQQNKLASTNDKRVFRLRLAIISMLLFVTGFISSYAYKLTNDPEQQMLQESYKQESTLLLNEFSKVLINQASTASALAETYSSQFFNASALGENSTFPFTTLPFFDAIAVPHLSILNARAISFNPLLNVSADPSIQWEWEAYAKANSWRQNALVRNAKNGWGLKGVYDKDASGNKISAKDHFLVPVWQIAPIANSDANYKAVMFNLYSETVRRDALNRMLSSRSSQFTAMLKLVQDTTGILRPSTICFSPVFNLGSNSTNNAIVASISVVFTWDKVFSSNLLTSADGLVFVLKTSCTTSCGALPQTFTYAIKGGAMQIMGAGDQHDTAYDSTMRSVTIRLGSTSEKEIDYTIMVYSSRELEAKYVTNRPFVFTITVVLIALFTSCLFGLYDYLMRDKQKALAELASRSAKIVDSLFPSFVRARLFGAPEEDEQNHEHANSNSNHIEGLGSLDTITRGNTTSGGGTASAQRLRRFFSRFTGVVENNGADDDSRLDGVSGGSNSSNSSVNNDSASNSYEDFNTTYRRRISTSAQSSSSKEQSYRSPEKISPYAGAPIADSFASVSVLFADIAGFTLWSSKHPPAHVFVLLETLYRAFDSSTSLRKTFKVETIGDCYLAVCGLPIAVDDHAAAIADFALDMLDHMEDVKARLTSVLGQDVNDLQLRVGIHSGQVTAGVLRGEKSRFQLFGDTVNTASRMESTGKPGRIQISSETYSLLHAAGLDAWTVKRNELVEAKGKGLLQTYWIQVRH